MAYTEFTNAITNADGAPEISPQELKEKLGDANLKLVDVRRPDEYIGELGHIKEAELITLETELESKMDSLPQDKTLVFICRSGKRSTKATLMAQEKGFKSIFNLEGGMMKWSALEYPTDS